MKVWVWVSIPLAIGAILYFAGWNPPPWLWILVGAVAMGHQLERQFEAIHRKLDRILEKR